MKFKPEDLEGKEVEFTALDGTKIKGVVTGCDESIGITIQEKGGLESYLFCYHGPLSLRAKELKRKYDERDKADFEHMINMLRKGYFDCAEDQEFCAENNVTDTKLGSTIASARTCPFNQ